MSDYIISIDAGNGGVNAVLAQENGLHKSIYFPSVRAAVYGDSLGLGAEFETEVDYVQWGGHNYSVGDSVKSTHKRIERHQGAFRYGDEFHTFLMTVAIAKLGITKGNIKLTTFAPPGMFVEARDAIKNRLEESKNRLAIQLKGDEEPRIFNIESITVHPEGLGALLCFALDKNGKMVETALLDGENVVLDMGMYTLDALQISDGNFNAESLANATWEKSGIKEHILDPMLYRIKKQGGEDFDLITVDDIDKVIRRGLKTETYNLTVASISVDIKPLLDKYSERYAQWIANNVIDGIFNGLRGVKSMILVGGGATFTRDWLIQWYGDKVLDSSKHKTMQDIEPIEMNAVGGLRLALSKEQNQP